MAEKTNLLGLDRAGLEAFVAGLGAKPFRARQLMQWMHQRGESDFDRMTDLAKDFRAGLATVAGIRVPEVVTSQRSADGTRKWVLRMPGAEGVEGLSAETIARRAMEIAADICIHTNRNITIESL